MIRQYECTDPANRAFRWVLDTEIGLVSMTHTEHEHSLISGLMEDELEFAVRVGQMREVTV